MVTIKHQSGYVDFLYDGYVVATVWLNQSDHYPVVLYTDRVLRQTYTWLYDSAQRKAYLWTLLHGKTIIDCWRSRGII